MTDHDIQRRLVVAVTVPLALMLVMLALLALLVVRLSTVTREVADIEASISIANNLERLIVDAETGFRAFLLVAGDDFLEPTNAADMQLPTRFAELRPTVSGDGEQLARLDRIERTLRTWRSLVDQEIRAKRTGGDYLTIVASRQPKRYVDSMRADLTSFVTRQRAVRDSRSAAAAAFTRGVVAAIGAAAVLVAVTMWLVTWRQVARSSATYAHALETTRRSRDELKAAAETLESRVAERTQLLTAANEELEALSYSVSHDLRAPIRHVSGFAELLKQQTSATSDPKVRHYVERILRRTDEAGELIDQLLTFSRTGRVPMEFGDVATGCDRSRRHRLAARHAAAADRVDDRATAGGPR